MSLDSAQVVNSMISFYRRKGADLSYLLGDPVFTKLPLEDKVEAIKNHATTLLNGTSSRLNQQERGLVRGEIGGAMVGGALTGFGVAKAVMNNTGYGNALARNKALAVTAGVAALSGLGAGALMGRIKADKLYSQRQAIRNELFRTAKDPSTDNALGVLSAGHLHNNLSLSRENILDKVMKKVDHFVSENQSDIFKKNFKDQYESFDGQGHPLTRNFK